MTPSKLLGNRALGVERKPHLSLLSWLEAMYINEPSNWPTLFGYELAMLLSFRTYSAIFRGVNQPPVGARASIIVTIFSCEGWVAVALYAPVGTTRFFSEWSVEL
jgi:hypothetical protein